jgi:hypothetical protein
MRRLLVLSFSVVAGCTFPEVSILETGGGGSGGATGGAPTGGADGGMAGMGGIPTTDGGGGSGGAPVDPCNMDGDAEDANTVECGGTDCNDMDARVRDSQTQYFATADSRDSFDYNCNTIIEPEFPTACAIGCSSNDFVLDVPDGAAGCGQTGALQRCDGLLCSAGSVENPAYTQRCK